MKNKIFFLLFLAAGILSCGGPNNEQLVSGISLSRTDLTLALGDSLRITCDVQPSSMAGKVSVAWESSDPTVLTVDQRGYIRTYALGTAVVTASCEGFQASCQVAVKPYLETISFTGAVMACDEPDTAYFGGTLYDGTMNGQTVHVYKSLLTLQLLSEGLYLNNDGELSGATKGAIITVKAPMLYGTKAQNNGQKVGQIIHSYAILDAYKEDNYTAPAGHINEPAYLAGIAAYCEAYNAGNNEGRSEAMDAAAAAVSGTTVMLVEYHSREEGYPQDGYVLNEMPEALVTSGSFTLTPDGLTSRMYGLTNVNLTVKPLLKDNARAAGEVFYFWGVPISNTADGLSVAAEQVYFSPTITYSL